MVSTLKATINWTNTNGEKIDDDTIFYYLKENGLGERKCAHEGTGNCSGEYTGKNHRLTHPFYLENIRPWLAGRYEPEIPSYESIKAKEFKDALAGKVT